MATWDEVIICLSSRNICSLRLICSLCNTFYETPTLPQQLPRYLFIKEHPPLAPFGTEDGWEQPNALRRFGPYIRKRLVYLPFIFSYPFLTWYGWYKLLQITPSCIVQSEQNIFYVLSYHIVCAVGNSKACCKMRRLHNRSAFLRGNLYIFFSAAALSIAFFTNMCQKGWFFLCNSIIL